MRSQKQMSAFTLLELLIVMSIIGVLAAILLVAVKPQQIFEKGRDTQRIADLNNLSKTINTALVENSQLVLGESSVVYISLPDSSAICTTWLLQLPLLPFGWQYRCSAESNYRKVDGTGWIPVNFASVSLLNLQSLPIDPSNNPPNYYSYVSGGSFELTAALENNNNKGKDKKGGGDLGDHNFVYEAGDDLKLTPSSVQARAEEDSLKQSLRGWWSFDEKNGTTTRDQSGVSNSGNLIPGPVWSDGKEKNALTFNGLAGYVSAGSGSLIANSSASTVSLWAKANPSQSASAYATFYAEDNAGGPVFGVGIGPGKILNFSIYISGVWYPVSPNPVLTNDWTHYVAVLDPSFGMKFYINGNLIATGSNKNPSNYSPIRISFGRNTWGGGSTFNGIIDEVRAYNRVLTDEEIKILYEALR